MSSEIEIEPVPGLPEDLPAGEEILWQGRPDWRALARETFRVKIVSAYLAAMCALRFVVVMRDGGGILAGVVGPVSLAVACLVVLHWLAWINARSAVYTVTSRRIVMRIGVAIPTAWNIPFKRIASADLVTRAKGDGDIALTLTEPNRIAWLHLWPHTRPWQLTKARPTLRAIAQPAKVASLLSEAVASWGATGEAPVFVSTSAIPLAPSGPSTRPAGGVGAARFAAEAGR